MASDKIKDIPASKFSENFFATLNSEIFRMESSGADIIRLDIGNPDLPPADHIIKALNVWGSRKDAHGYQPHRGTEELREAWARMYRQKYGVDIDPEIVLPLLGSKEGVFHLSIAVLNPGDVVLIPDPSYQTYSQVAKFANAVPILFPLDPENDYLPDFSAIPAETAKRAKLMWLNYPNNPTGAVASIDILQEAVEFCRKYEIILCHDAAYSQVTFDYQAPSIFQIPDSISVAIELNTLSKSHNMAGWRVGAAIGHKESRKALYKLKTHADSGHFLPVIQAAIAAMSGDQSWLEERNKIYMKRRDELSDSLRRIGFTPQKPKASLYIWCPLPKEWTSETFVLETLKNTHVSFAPGIVFGCNWDKYIRISLTQPIERIQEAMERLSKWL